MFGFSDLRRTCSEFRRQAVDRRGFLKAGMLGTCGISLAELLRQESLAGTRAVSTDKSVIILWMRGGPSHIDMWDTKPDAPAEIRGEFGTTKTNVAGIQISDMLPMCARVMDKWSIIRSLHHGNAGHSAGDQILFTGYPPGPNPNDNVMPSCGSIVAGAAWPPHARVTSLCNDPANGSRYQLGAPGRRV